MQARTELQAKEQELRKKSSELQALSSEKDQTIAILQDELDIGAAFLVIAACMFVQCICIGFCLDGV